MTDRACRNFRPRLRGAGLFALSLVLDLLVRQHEVDGSAYCLHPCLGDRGRSGDGEVSDRHHSAR